jgi:hypothetical protein
VKITAELADILGIAVAEVKELQSIITLLSSDA